MKIGEIASFFKGRPRNIDQMGYGMSRRQALTSIRQGFEVVAGITVLGLGACSQEDKIDPLLRHLENGTSPIPSFIALESTVARDLARIAESDVSLEQKTRIVEALITVVETKGFYRDAADEALEQLVQSENIDNTLKTRIVDALVATLGEQENSLPSPEVSVLTRLSQSEALAPDLIIRIVDGFLVAFRSEIQFVRQAVTRPLEQLIDFEADPAITNRIFDGFFAATSDEVPIVRLYATNVLKNLVIWSSLSCDLKARMVRPMLNRITDDEADIRVSSLEILRRLAESDISPDLKETMVEPLMAALTLAISEQESRGFSNDNVYNTINVLESLVESDISSDAKERMVTPLLNAWLHQEFRSTDVLIRLAESDISAPSQQRIVTSVVESLINELQQDESSGSEALDAVAESEISSPLKGWMFQQLVAAFERGDNRVRLAIINVLHSLARSNIENSLREQIVRFLVGQMRHSNEGIRNEASYKLSDLAIFSYLSSGVDVHLEITDAFLSLLTNSRQELRDLGRDRLLDLLRPRSIGGYLFPLSLNYRILDGFLAALRHRNVAVRIGTLGAMSSMITQGTSVPMKERMVDPVIVLLNDENEDVRHAAYDLLAAIHQHESEIYYSTRVHLSPDVSTRLISALRRNDK